MSKIPKIQENLSNTEKWLIENRTHPRFEKILSQWDICKILESSLHRHKEEFESQVPREIIIKACAVLDLPTEDEQKVKDLLFEEIIKHAPPDGWNRELNCCGHDASLLTKIEELILEIEILKM